MRYPPLSQLNGVFGVIKPVGLTAAKTCNQIRRDLTRGIKGHFASNCFFTVIVTYCFI